MQGRTLGKQNIKTIAQDSREPQPRHLDWESQSQAMPFAMYYLGQSWAYFVQADRFLSSLISIADLTGIGVKTL